ncbi:MAG: response regulator [Rhodospirillales bacterium]|nr:response regulator [Rhodospirillales bacterium]
MKNFDLSEMSALVVEKNHPMRAMLRGILRELGVKKIYDTATPEDGFDAFNHDQPDIVLVDWCPDFDGIGLLHKIRTDPESHNPFAPVIMVTAHSEADRVIQARDAGMTEYLSKPVSAKRLYQRISSIVESQRAFVRISEFFGPDRRRQRVGITDDDRRSGTQAH